MKGTVGLGARATALLLIAAMLATAEVSPTEKILTASPNAVIRVTLTTGEKLTGRIKATETESYTIRVATRNSVVERELRYSETTSVRVVKSRETETLKQASANSAVRTLTTIAMVLGFGLLFSVTSR